MNRKLVLQKRGIWGGLTIERIGNGKRGYYWIGEGQKYLVGITFAEAKRLCRFIQSK